MQKSFQQTDNELQASEGLLYLVGTPIGNLEDMTFRAVRILGEVDCIAAENTRQTRKLLSHFQISSRMVSYHEHNKRTSGPELIRMLLEGQSVALVSDAGLPAISDPGYELVCLAIDHQISVVPVPGANAALSALIVSGQPTDQFTFIGFLPRENKKLAVALDRYKHHEATLICYEAPHRVEKTLNKMLEVWGDRPCAMARELTKKYEEITRGLLSECIAWLQRQPPKGEYCIIVQGKSPNEGQPEQLEWWRELTIEQHVAHYMHQNGNKKEAIKLAAVDRKVPKRDIYNHFIR